MLFRKGNENDLKELKVIEDESFVPPYTIDQLLYELKENPVSNYLVCVDDKTDKVVGFLDYWITFDSATICQIAVLEKYRNHGIASNLIEEMIKDLKAHDVEFLTLEVRKSNVKATKLYEKNGFLLITTKVGYYSDGEDALYMMKGLI